MGPDRGQLLYRGREWLDERVSAGRDGVMYSFIVSMAVLIFFRWPAKLMISCNSSSPISRTRSSWSQPGNMAFVIGRGMNIDIKVMVMVGG